MFEKTKHLGATVSTVAVAISAIHVIAASVYLYFYCLGFGANLSMFYDATDIFTISITKLANVYIQSLVIPALGLWMLRVIRVKSNQEWIEAAPNPDSALRRKRYMRISTIASCATLGVATCMIILKSGRDWWVGDYVPAYNLIMIALMTIFVGYSINSTPRFEIVFTLFFFAGVVGGSLDSGQADRNVSYTSSRPFPECSELRLIGRASHLYVAVGPTDSKFLIDSDCTVAFALPDPEVRWRPSLHPDGTSKR